MAEIKNIVIIGAGNVGTQLACAFRDAACNIRQVAGRRGAAVKSLAEMTGAEHSISFDNIIKGQDLYLMALPDDAMNEILPKLGLTDELLVHTSGSVPMDILSPYSENTGVFYPLQTFTRNRKIDLSVVPFLVEANRIDNEDQLLTLGKKLSGNVKVADSMKRELMHIAAVFASNFSNHMYDIARKLMRDNGFDFDLLIPLIRETAAKAVELGPDQSQTGPALRKDMQVIEKHLDLLRNNPAARELYERISKNIIDQTDNANDEL
ncbi:MAG: Rossmann-like and DUF2520 domain-containing protein [Bacteroidota bacterium]